jgi:hypothetical protein
LVGGTRDIVPAVCFLREVICHVERREVMRTRRIGSLVAIQELFGKILSLRVGLLFSLYLRTTIKGAAEAISLA